MSTVENWIRALPARSVVIPAGISALLPALIARLSLLSVRSPLSAGSPVRLALFVPLTQPVLSPIKLCCALMLPPPFSQSPPLLLVTMQLFWFGGQALGV